MFIDSSKIKKRICISECCSQNFHRTVKIKFLHENASLTVVNFMELAERTKEFIDIKQKKL
jgi:hypothetical protein